MFIFAPMKTTKNITVSVPIALADRIRVIAHEQGRKVSNVVVDWLEVMVKGYKARRVK